MFINIFSFTTHNILNNILLFLKLTELSMKKSAKVKAFSVIRGPDTETFLLISHLNPFQNSSIKAFMDTGFEKHFDICYTNFGFLQIVFIIFYYHHNVLGTNTYNLKQLTFSYLYVNQFH